MEKDTQVVGKVELRLQDYLDLRDAQSLAVDQRRQLVRISKQLEIFLSFLSREEVFINALQQFNAQSTECEIHIVDNRVKIEMRNAESN